LPNKNLILAPYKKNRHIAPEIISASAIGTIQRLEKYNLRQRSCCWHFRRKHYSLSRAITLVESTNSGHLAKANEVINACLPHANQSVRIELQAFQAWVKVLLLKLWNLFN
jgi:LAO/AO transport system kinase